MRKPQVSVVYSIDRPAPGSVKRRIIQMEKITSANQVDERIAKTTDKILVCFFTAGWCGPARITRPFVENVCAELSVDAMEIDIDEYRDIATRFAVQGLPTTLILKNGQVVDRYLNAFPNEEKCKTWIQPHLG